MEANEGPLSRKLKPVSRTLDFSDALELINQPQDENRIWNIVERIDPSTEIERNKFYSYYDLGIQFCFRKHEEAYVLISLIFFLCGAEADEDDPAYQTYEGSLPLGLKSGMARRDIETKLGLRAVEREESNHRLFGRQRPWIKYYPKKDVQIFIELENDMIHTVHVSQAIY